MKRIEKLGELLVNVNTTKEYPGPMTIGKSLGHIKQFEVTALSPRIHLIEFIVLVNSYLGNYEVNDYVHYDKADNSSIAKAASKLNRIITSANRRNPNFEIEFSRNCDLSDVLNALLHKTLMVRTKDVEINGKEYIIITSYI